MTQTSAKRRGQAFSRLARQPGGEEPKRAGNEGGSPTDKPRAPDIDVTIAIAGYNCELYLEHAVRSALSQNLALEIIIVNDASTDGTAALADRLAATDTRIRVIHMIRNSGPAGARNAALDAAQGRWFAILDADDLMHPDRLATLVALGEAEEADLVADDLIVFDDANRKHPSRFLRLHRPGSTTWITLADYLGSTRMSDNRPNLGYLKPVIRLSRLKQADIRYDERLRIGEDDHFIFAMLLAGFQYRLLTVPGYFYRKHSNSISHRLSRATIGQIAAVSEQMGNMLQRRSDKEKAAFEARAKSVARTANFVDFLDHLKAGKWARALATIAAHPGTLPLLRRPPLDRLKGWIEQRTCRPCPPDQLLIIAGADGQQQANRLAKRLQEQGYAPLLLAIANKQEMPVTAVKAPFRGVTTIVPPSYFLKQADGATIFRTRLTLLRLSRSVERAIIITPLPDGIAREFTHLAMPISYYRTREDIESILSSLGAEKSASSRRHLSEVD